MFKPEVYKRRRENLKKLLSKGVYLIMGNNETPMNYPDNTYHFRQDSNFLYFYGLDIAGMAAIIDIDNDKEIIFANDVDIDDIIWMGPQPSVKELASKCLINETQPFSELVDYLQKSKKAGRKIHFLPPYKHDNMIYLNKVLGVPFEKMKEEASLEFILAVVALRNVKEQVEIEEIDKACNIGYLMHTTSMKMTKPGLYEREIAGVMEGVSLSYGSVPSFPIILTKNGQTLHNHYHGNKLKEGDLLLQDAGAQTPMYYASDNTRTLPVGGKFTSKQKDVYEIVLNSINGSIKLMKPRVKYLDVHLSASEILASGLKDLGLMKGDIKEAVKLGAHALFMPHGLGHMMGLDVHDMEDLGQINVGYDEETRPSDIFGTAFLRMGRELKPGYVLTNEPGIYFIPELIDIWKKERKFTDFINYDKLVAYRDFGGIRLEDDILITENGSRILGEKRIPISVEEVESFMRG
ncbi:MAG: aminopeptidase P family protein [Bacteroidales bacterium]|nr:aminopeptidase P family protein [Bacteroidales bacterium]MDY0141687.1 aminopeptidase P family protein [Bacteroidales bacterium]